MKPLNFLLFLLFTSRSTTSPVAFIIRNLQEKPPILLTCGIIVTERFVATATKPLKSFIINDICVTPAFNMETTKPSVIKKFCVAVKFIHLAEHVEFALIERAQAMPFYYGINPAMIPAVKSPDKPLDLRNHCKVVSHDRGRFDLVVGQDLVDVTVAYGANTSDYMEVTLSKDKKFCMHDTGLPVYCELAVVGILTLAHNSPKSCCVDECGTYTKVEALKLVDDDVQIFLRQYVQAIPSD